MVTGKYKRGKIAKSCMHVNGGEAMTLLLLREIIKLQLSNHLG